MLFASSCSLFRPEQMLRTPADFQFAEANDSLIVYRLIPNDIIEFELYSNKGYELIDLITGQSNIKGANSTYLIEFDGTVKLPIFGRLKISGLTLREAEKLLENKYSEFYKDPFAKLKVTNHRVTIFPGGKGGTAKVLKLENPNTTLFEALAQAGGITDGKAHRVKLIRGNLKNPVVLLLDLSTIEGVKNSNLVLQANDIIYIEPQTKLASRVAEAVAPYLTLFTTILVVANLLGTK